MLTQLLVTLHLEMVVEIVFMNIWI